MTRALAAVATICLLLAVATGCGSETSTDAAGTGAATGLTASTMPPGAGASEPDGERASSTTDEASASGDDETAGGTDQTDAGGASDADGDDTVDPSSVVGILASVPELSVFGQAADAAELDVELAVGDHTLFAPTDRALRRAIGTQGEVMLAPEDLDAIVRYHAVAGVLRLTDLEALAPGSLTTVEGSELAVTLEQGTVRVGGVEIEEADLPASDGIVHVLDGMLRPPDD